MNKKGFTLVELLAVVVLIGVISTVAIVSLTGVRKNIDVKTVASNYDLIMVAAKSYGEENITDYYGGAVKDFSVSEIKNNTELSIDDAYNSINVTLKLENSRISACIKEDDNNKGILTELVGEEHVNDEIFDKYWC